MATNARDKTARNRKKAAEYLATLKKGRQLVFINKLERGCKTIVLRQ